MLRLAFAYVNLGENLLKSPCTYRLTHVSVLSQINKVHEEENQYSVSLIIKIVHVPCRQLGNIERG